LKILALLTEHQNEKGGKSDLKKNQNLMAECGQILKQYGFPNLVQKLLNVKNML